MSRRVLPFVVACTGLLVHTVALACSCVGYTPESAAGADAVFVGQIAQAGGCSRPVYTVIVQEAVAGVTDGEQLRMRSAASDAACGVSAAPGDLFFVFTNRDDDGDLSLSLCSSLPVTAAEGAALAAEVRALLDE